MKLIHLTDTHFVAPGLTLYGLDPRARLDAAVADINRKHADAEIAVVTGDLTHWGEPAAYANLKESLEALAIPAVPLMGNHDERGAFYDAFPDAPLDSGGFIQGVQATEAGSLVFLDTNQPGTHAGWYCAARLAWLADVLATAAPPFYFFMHHPPFDVGLAPMDRIGLQQAAAFREVVTPYARDIRHIFYGHVHRPICGSWIGIAHSTIRATNHQVWLDFEYSGDDLPFSYEEPAYAVALIGDDSVVIHSHDYLYERGIYASAVNASEAEERVYALNFTKAAE